MGRSFSNYYTYDEELYRNSTARSSNKKEIQKLSAQLKECIKEDLTEKQMELVTLYYFKNMTIPEIADLLCRNKSTISRGLKSARIKLKSILRYSDIGKFI